MNHIAELPTVAVLAIVVAWGAKAKSGIGLSDVRHHFIGLSLEDEGTREVIHRWGAGAALQTNC